MSVQQRNDILAVDLAVQSLDLLLAHLKEQHLLSVTGEQLIRDARELMTRVGREVAA